MTATLFYYYYYFFFLKTHRTEHQRVSSSLIFKTKPSPSLYLSRALSLTPISPRRASPSPAPVRRPPSLCDGRLAGGARSSPPNPSSSSIKTLAPRPSLSPAPSGPSARLHPFSPADRAPADRRLATRAPPLDPHRSISRSRSTDLHGADDRRPRSASPARGSSDPFASCEACDPRLSDSPCRSDRR